MANEENILLCIYQKNEKFVCNICEKEFATKGQVMEHIKFSHKDTMGNEDDDNPNNETFIDPEECITEMNSSDNAKKFYSCKVCGVKSEIKDNVEDHVVETHKQHEIIKALKSKELKNKDIEEKIMEEAMINSIEVVQSDVINHETATNRGWSIEVDQNGVTSSYACNACVEMFTCKDGIKKHISEHHFISKASVQAGIEVEKKDYTLNELKALKKKREFQNRTPVEIRSKVANQYKNSVSVDFKTSLFEHMKKKGFVDMSKYLPQIIQINATRLVSADAGNDKEAAIEYQGEAMFKEIEGEYKVKLKLYTTTCSLQIQVMGDIEERKEFESKLNMTPAEYFADLVVEYGDKIIKEMPNIDDEYIPKDLEKKIEEMEAKTAKTASNPMENQISKKTSDINESGDRKCNGCPRNIVLKNKRVYSDCQTCGKIEHFNCAGIKSENRKKKILEGKISFHCHVCVTANPALESGEILSKKDPIFPISKQIELIEEDDETSDKEIGVELEENVVRETEGVQKVFSCDVCGRMFKNFRNLGIHKTRHTSITPDNYMNLKNEYLALKKSFDEKCEEGENLSDSNERLKEILKTETDKKDADIAALKIGLNEANDSFRASDSERLRLQSENSNLHKIYEVMLEKERNEKTTPNRNTKSKAAEEVMKKDNDEMEAEEEEDDSENVWIRRMREMRLTKLKGYNRKDGPAVVPNQNNASINGSKDKITNNDKDNENESRKNMKENVTRTRVIDARTSNRDCHYWNNYNKECPFESKCRFQHKKSEICQFDGYCEKSKCIFYHEKQSFLENGQATDGRRYWWTRRFIRLPDNKGYNSREYNNSYNRDNNRGNNNIYNDRGGVSQEWVNHQNQRRYQN